MHSSHDSQYIENTMNDNKKRELNFLPLPGHDCRVSSDHWSGRYSALKLRQGISVSIFKISISKKLENIFTSNAPDSDYIAGCIVISGQLQIKFPNQKVLALEPQRFSVFPAHEMNFQLTAPPQEKLYLLTYSFPGKLLKWFMKGRDSHVAACYASEDVSRCRYLGIPVSREIHRSVAEIMGSRLDGQLLKLYLEGAILKVIAQKFVQLEKLPPDSDLLPPKSEVELLNEARDYLLVDLVSPPTIKELALQVGMPEKRLSASFKKEFGATIYDTLMEKRMTESMEKLKQGKQSLKQVAQAVGYKHVSNFISAFTKYHGLPPKAYQQSRK